MKVIDVKELFKRLITLEYNVLKYINRTQGEESRPIDFSACAAALNVDKRAVYNAHKRLVTAGVLIPDGLNFKINDKVFVKE